MCNLMQKSWAELVTQYTVLIRTKTALESKPQLHLKKIEKENIEGFFYRIRPRCSLSQHENLKVVKIT